MPSPNEGGMRDIDHTPTLCTQLATQQASDNNFFADTAFVIQIPETVAILVEPTFVFLLFL